MKKNILIGIILALFVIAIIMLLNINFSNNSKENNTPREFKEIADYYKEAVHKFQPSDFDSEPVDLFLSSIVEDVFIIKLDNENEDALLNGRAFPFLTESYIGITSDELPYKLYDKSTGRFLRNIGKIGEGPGEYSYIYNAVIDEKNNRIYINSIEPGILVYNLDGEFLEKINIPGITGTRKTRFTVNDSIINAFIMTFDGDKNAVITFNTKGDSISSAPAKVFMTGNYNPEVFIQTNTANPGYRHTASAVYFNYDPIKKELVPAFAFDKNKFTYVYISELPNFYFFDVSVFNKEKTYYITDHVVYYDKKSQKGQPANLINDFIGEIPFSQYSFSNGKYIERITASDFREKAKNAIKKNKLSEMKKKYLSDLMNSMTDDDNDIILYGELKK